MYGLAFASTLSNGTITTSPYHHRTTGSADTLDVRLPRPRYSAPSRFPPQAWRRAGADTPQSPSCSAFIKHMLAVAPRCLQIFMSKRCFLTSKPARELLCSLPMVPLTSTWRLLTQVDCEADPLRTSRVADLPARTLPLFLIVGSMKAGTSSLYSYINQHPQAMPFHSHTYPRTRTPPHSHTYPRTRTHTHTPPHSHTYLRTQSHSHTYLRTRTQSHSHDVVPTLAVVLNLFVHEREPWS